MVSELHELSAAEAAQEIRDGRLSSVELTRACLEQIERVDGEIEAWAFLDPDRALAEAAERDRMRGEGLPLGPLHGVPIGMKDIFDTADMPTENGSQIHAGRLPERDAAVVRLLKAAGALILGKTVTTEFAYFSPGKTRNPHDPSRTPGGSSSGSAAAVAAKMVPAAIGSQTNGSMIRPAAYCGVVGYKPSYGLIPRSGALALSHTLDQVGVFARTVEDAALVAEVMVGFDAADPDTRPIARPNFAALAAAESPLPPRIAFVRTPVWDKAEPSTQTAFTEMVAGLGGQVEEVELDLDFAEVWENHRIIMEVEMARNLRREYSRSTDLISPVLRSLIERGQACLAVDYLRGKEEIAPFNAALNTIFDRFDAILTPAATGEAPADLTATGSPVFCTLWTYLGTPALSLPLLNGPNGLPLGVQLVGRRGDDAQLLRTGRWLAQTVGGAGRRQAAAQTAPLRAGSVRRVRSAFEGG